MSTPYLDEAERCARVALLHDGRLLALDTPAALRATLPGSLFEVIAPDHRERSRRCERCPAWPSVQTVRRAGARAAVDRARRMPRRDSTRRLRGCGRRRDAACGQVPASLEDVFVAQARRDAVMNTSRSPIDASRARCCVSLLVGRRRRGAAGAAPPLSLTLDEAIARGAGDQPSARRSAAPRRRRGRGRRASGTRPTLPQVAALGRLHAHQSRGRVRHPAAEQPAARHLSGHSGQLPHAARPAVADLHRRPARGARDGGARRAERRRATIVDAARADLRLEIDPRLLEPRHGATSRCASSTSRWRAWARTCATSAISSTPASCRRTTC